MSIVSIEKDFDEPSLTLVAEFDAPIAHVWRLWEDPRQLERWWGPPSHPATMVTHDLAAGGEVTYFMTGPDGTTSHGWWRVTAVSPPTALEFIDGWAHADGTPNAALPTMTVQVQLAERDGTTRMELRFNFASAEHMRQLQRGGAFEIFPQSVGQMDALLTNPRPTDG
jgi:uncharacterized protein YndB with AHSA1/START domain